MRFVIRKDVYDEIVKSLGIRDYGDLIPKKIMVNREGKWYYKTVLVKPEMVHNPYKHNVSDMPEVYSDDFPKLLKEVKDFNFDGKSEQEVWDMTRKMGKLNSLCIKGKKIPGILRTSSIEEESINKPIYAVKRAFTQNLAKYYIDHKLDITLFKLETDKKGILYIRDSKTNIQESFHQFDRETLPEEYKNKLEVTEKAVWDRVPNAFEYDDPKAYEEAKEIAKTTHDKFKWDFLHYSHKFYNDKLKKVTDKILSTKSFQKLLPENTEINIKFFNDLDITENSDFNKDIEIYGDNFIDKIKNSKVALSIIYKPNVNLRVKNQVEDYISKYLAKKEMPLNKINEIFADEMEKSFILGEIS